MRAFNRLTEAQAKLTAVNGDGLWSTQNLTVSNSVFSSFRPDGFRQLALKQIDPLLTNKLTLSSISTPQSDLDKDMSFFFAARMESGGSITVKITEDVYGQVDIEETVDITSNTNIYPASSNFGSTAQNFKWTVVRVPSFKTLGTNLAAGYNIEISFHPTESTEEFYFSSPVLVGYYDFFFNNTVLADLGKSLPHWLIDKDIENSANLNPDILMTRYMDIASGHLDLAFDYMRKFIYLDIQSGYTPTNPDTKSILVDPTVADYVTLLWLLVFTFTKPISRFQLVPDYIPDPFILDQSALDGTDRLLLSSSNDTSPPEFSRELQIQLLRWQAYTGYYGGFAGTINAVKEAAKQMLFGSQTLTVNYNYDVEPWVINLTSPYNQTFGGDITLIGESSPLVMEAVSYAKPLGVLVTHQMTAFQP